MKKKARFPARRYNLPFILGAILIAISAMGVSYFVFTHTLRKKTLQQYAQDVYIKCKSVGYPPSCYDEEIPKLMDYISMEDAFTVTRYVQQKDPRYLYCHVLAHKLSYRETSKDLSKWKDVVTRCPTDFCNNGCQHGALMRRFNAESLTDAQIAQIKPDLMDVCEPRGKWNPTEVERSMCYHALGHLNMFITKADINKSVGLCNEVGVKQDGRSYVQTCTQGVLMSVYQPLEPEDYALVKNITPKKEGVNAFCDQFTGESWLACHSESWPLFTDQLETPQGFVAFCSYATDSVAKSKCYSNTMGILTVHLVVDQGNTLGKLKDYCSALPQDMASSCFANASFRLVQIDPRYEVLAIGVCDEAPASMQQACYELLMTHAVHSFHPGSSESKNFCMQMKEPWQSQCLQTSASSK